jgi:4-alpha-glucanotransferase
MRNLGALANKRPPNSVTILFKIPYYTQWGQSLVIAGSDPIFGSWNLKQAISMDPVHQGSELVWCAKASVRVSFECEYNYYLVDDSRNVLRWEPGKKRKLVLPHGVKEGDVVEIHDLWQVILEKGLFGLFLCQLCNLHYFLPLFMVVSSHILPDP